MMNELTIPKTLQEAILHYSDLDKCLEVLVANRWPEGVTCPHCQAKNVTFMKSVRRWQCKNKPCRKQFSFKVGTYMEDSPIGLDKWLAAMWMITNAKNGISSYEIHRALGVTQKTAWFMLHRIRLAFNEEAGERLGGPVEADETYIGGLEKNKHESKKLKQGRGTVGKTIVMGVLDRCTYQDKPSQVRTVVINDTSRKTLHGQLAKNVKPGAAIYTDALPSYQGLAPEYIHEFVDHAVAYVQGHVHTNGIENFWSLLKRCIKGTYVSIEPFHLFRYLDEQAFRFNNRKSSDSERFVTMLGSVKGRRLTYAKLTRSYETYYQQIMPYKS